MRWFWLSTQGALAMGTLVMGCASGEASLDEDDGKTGETEDDDGSAPPPDGDPMPDIPPVVIETTPTAGDVAVNPDTDEIRVTFSKDMQPESWSYVTSPLGEFPDVTGDPVNEGERTVVLSVALEPGETYAMWLNDEGYTNFLSESQVPAVPYLLSFQTADE